MRLWRFLILAAWLVGVGLLRIKHRYDLFIRPELWPLLLGTFIMLALFLVAMFIRGTHSRRPTLSDWVRGGLLILPLFYLGNLVTGAAATGLNSNAFANKFLGFSSQLGGFPDSGGGSLGPDSATNLGYIARHLHDLTGKHVVTEGRVWHDDTRPAGQVVIFRFVIVCCAADAIPVQAVIETPKSAALKDDSWIRVSGTLRSETDPDGDVIPIIKADKIAQIPTPDEPYLSPYQF